MGRVRTGGSTQSRSPFDRLGAYHGIEEYFLRANGLRLLHYPDTSSPVVGVMVTYLVGSRHEAVGHTGATHLLEHLMFRGSKAFPNRRGVSVLDLLGDKGALVNATTWLDRTNYYEVLPREHAAFALAVEADRMRHAAITPRDLAEEMPAVRSEYALRVENDPHEYLDERIWATAFMAHPYHHPTIGWLSDIEHVSLAQLLHFYNTYYWPNNAVLSVVGDIDRETLLPLVAQHFGVHPRAPHEIPVPYTVEPPQQGKRTVEVRRAGTKQVVGLAWKVPEARHSDTPALIVLATLLADGRTSRLYRALVERRRAAEVATTYRPFRDPSLLPVYVTAAAGVRHDSLEREVLRAVKLLQEEGVHARDVARVVAQIEAELVFTRDGHYATLAALNEAIAVADWRYFFDLPGALAKVTPEDVRRVARTYLTDDSLTIGRYYATS